MPISSSQGAYQNDNGLDAAQHGAMQLAQLSQQPGMMGGVGLPMMQVNMGTGRLVAAMEHLDRIVGAFADDMGRSVAQIRSEINAEREMAMLEVAQTQSAVDAPVAGTWTGDVATPLPPTTASKSRLLPESSSSPRMPKLRLNTSQQAIGANGLPSPGARGAVTLPSAISPRSPASRRPAFLLSNGEPQPMRSPRLRREISYLNESKGHGILARSPADLDFVLPPSAVPETNAVYARSPLPPSSEAAPSAHSSDEGDDITPKPLLWQNRVFPNRLPASRQDCVLLSHWLGAMDSADGDDESEDLARGSSGGGGKAGLFKAAAKLKLASAASGGASKLANLANFASKSANRTPKCVQNAVETVRETWIERETAVKTPRKKKSEKGDDGENSSSARATDETGEATAGADDGES